MKTEKRPWDIEDVEKCFKHITKGSYTNTNFDDLMKNIQNNKDLYKLTYDVLFGEDDIAFNARNYIMSLGIAYGIFAREEKYLTISCPVYSQIIQATMLSLEQTGLGLGLNLGNARHKEDYLENNQFDMKYTLEQFQNFMKEFHSDKDEKFLETHGRFLLLAFLKPIVNGEGYLFKEPECSNNRKMDLVVSFRDERFVIELKIWRGRKKYDEGIEQLCDYLDSYSLDSGYLLVFNFNKNKKYEVIECEYHGKKITTVFV